MMPGTAHARPVKRAINMVCVYVYVCVCGPVRDSGTYTARAALGNYHHTHKRVQLRKDGREQWQRNLEEAR